ncbi:hypothetical protein CEK28_08335 [Xenophilus sp. AP218F]|nr:hypothetical protein CEK28_08335 [Xenophilus sp. AP218F]
MNFFRTLQRNRKLAGLVLALSTALFMLVSAVWQGGEPAGGAWRAALCPLLLLVAMFGQLSALLALLQKPRE